MCSWVRVSRSWVIICLACPSEATTYGTLKYVHNVHSDPWRTASRLLKLAEGLSAYSQLPHAAYDFFCVILISLAVQCGRTGPVKAVETAGQSLYIVARRVGWDWRHQSSLRTRHGVTSRRKRSSSRWVMNRFSRWQISLKCMICNRCRAVRINVKCRSCRMFLN